MFGSFMFLCDALGIKTNQTDLRERNHAKGATRNLPGQEEGGSGGEGETDLLPDSLCVG